MSPLRQLPLIGVLTWFGMLTAVAAAVPEWNPMPSRSVSSGASSDRILIGFKSTAANSSLKTIKAARAPLGLQVRLARTTTADAAAAAARAGLSMATVRQLTPGMHLLSLSKALSRSDVETTLGRLRADPSIAFAAVDGRRHAHALPNDPLFAPNANSVAGQWYLQAPSTLTPTSDASAIDAVSAWNFTTGAAGVVVADVDSGIRFDHPDLLRAGFGGRLLPGYDFVGQDYDATSGAALGTYLMANDQDGWDPDPSDPGDWVNATDQKNTTVFPSKDCTVEDSSWHGTRVMGVLGALTNNGVGVAGVTWNSYLLPVRALGKCGGYDSDIITAMEWSVGLPVTGVVDNPYPADIVNLSLGGSDSCPSSYKSVVNTLTAMGVLVVASAGNESGPVDTPGNCPGVLAVAGLRNIGTKVGYSSFGPEVGIAAPAGNCVNSSGACIRSIDTTFNTGLTSPAANSYTDQITPNLGTSFSAPIVSGVAALMRAVNANLTPPELIARLQQSANPFPQPNGTPQCPTVNSGTSECACVTGQCGAGMIDAFKAVRAALNPIATLRVPANLVAGPATFDASGSVAACNLSVAGYQWTRSGGVSIVAGATSAQVSINWSGASGSLTLTVTDSAGSADTAVVNFTGSGASTSAPASAGSAATACPAALDVVPAAPLVSEGFSPATVAVSANASLTYTLSNTNPFALTQAMFNQTLPAALSIATTPAATTTCTGTGTALNATASTLSLTGFIIPAQGSCSISLNVSSATAGAYMDTVAANALLTGPAGGNAPAAAVTLVVGSSAPPPTTGGGSGGTTGGGTTSGGTTSGGTTSASNGGHGGGGDLDWLDMLPLAIVLILGRHRSQVNAQRRRS